MISLVAVVAVVSVVFAVRGKHLEESETEITEETTSIPETELEKTVMVDNIVITGMSRDAAVAETALYVAAPGCSEHNLGLAADIVSSDWYSKNSGLESWFDQTPHYQWLSENAWKYGFILRYPKDKVEVTKIGYEPWHYRYVGTDTAKAIKDSGLTLEEYLGQ